MMHGMYNFKTCFVVSEMDTRTDTDGRRHFTNFFCALCEQVASKDVSEHFYLRRSHTFIALFSVVSFVVYEYVMPAQGTP
jgi:hypothetical protein